MSLKDTIANVFAQRDDRAVSPVIGVILMVAITVILAAVIGTMVLGMTDSVGNNVQAGANVQYDSNTENVTVTFTSNQNADYLTVNVNSGDATMDDENVLADVGNTTSLDVSSSVTSPPYHVIVTAHTSDGSSTVIVDKTISE